MLRANSFQTGCSYETVPPPAITVPPFRTTAAKSSKNCFTGGDSRKLAVPPTYILEFLSRNSAASGASP